MPDIYPEHFLWISPWANHTISMMIGSGNGLVSSGTKPSHEPMLINFPDVICGHQATMSYSRVSTYTLNTCARWTVSTAPYTDAIFVCKGPVTLPKIRVNAWITHKFRVLRDTSAICAFHQFFWRGTSAVVRRCSPYWCFTRFQVLSSSKLGFA